jgi:hypothetical protein
MFGGVNFEPCFREVGAEGAQRAVDLGVRLERYIASSNLRIFSSEYSGCVSLASRNKASYNSPPEGGVEDGGEGVFEDSPPASGDPGEPSIEARLRLRTNASPITFTEDSSVRPLGNTTFGESFGFIGRPL